MENYQPEQLNFTKYLFFTGKGGVGKTSTACATAVSLADSGKNVMLVGTDPASNLQDVFEKELTNNGLEIPEVKGLTVANFDPITAARDYMESVVGPYRGVLPDSAVANMEEQLLGSCTVEIASFNEFAGFLTNPEVEAQYDHIIFDTAPTGHTLRMLQLPSAWSNFLDENTTGVSCMGQLSGLGDKQEMYEHAVDTLSEGTKTTLMLVTRPQNGPLVEANRASEELKEIGVLNQQLIINGLLERPTDSVSQKIYDEQQLTLKNMPDNLKQFSKFIVPLRSYNVTGVENLRLLLTSDQTNAVVEAPEVMDYPKLQHIVDELDRTNKKVVFTMGKGGVGKTTIAATLATGLAAKGKKVHLATTDPAAHLGFVIKESDSIKMSHIDEKKELQDYKEEVLATARKTMSSEELDYVEEDLRSPCTQEIAVFRRFAEIVATVDCDVVAIDTAPTGHTLLLLDSSQSYAKEVERTSGEVPESVRRLLPVLQDPEQTEVVMVTLPENTPVYESMRLQEDLNRAKIAHTWWVINNSMLTSGTTNEVLKARAKSEVTWINKVVELSNDHFAVVEWSPIEVKGSVIESILN
ncbi:arsenical pump-driving ATPase [Tetragenococcus halophilus]|uniref:Arsenical pump-driving ATPase n=1 Tax=Tetragenococcus halophilus TaxID=51669 RepID=A0A3G5FHB3_TETHA|nr:arsenical pump-driving ATPase [Tetragenococcus halophilus]AYW49726.1 arsenical pump-driving ATPase [Tetragenococcus halophilus]MCO8291426.1 arsenical pump-driving ATPase [Tetragenococcus halophilus]MCT8311289.1 arsenical pump-driving ATPase [Tetragenococcus halophilus]MDN6724151.1 arsenical pump-driving ATPase [Tetragenococcus halophilus]GBD64485.1 Arsenical pump-driving ATPase ArsA [Tetragenococcus halophilus subsp. flandriensis]